MTDDEFMERYGYVWRTCSTCDLPIVVEKQYAPRWHVYYCDTCKSQQSFRERHGITDEDMFTLKGAIATILFTVLAWIFIFTH